MVILVLDKAKQVTPFYLYLCSLFLLAYYICFRYRRKPERLVDSRDYDLLRFPAGHETPSMRCLITVLFSDNVNDLYDDRGVMVMVMVLVNKPQEINDYGKVGIQAFHN